MSDLHGLAELTLPADARSLVPRLHDYFGPWAIEPTRGLAMWQHASRMDLRKHVAEFRADVAEARSFVSYYTQSGAISSKQIDSVNDGSAIAVVSLSGALMKSVPSMEDGTSTIRARNEIRAAINNQKVGAILLQIDSPGGTVSGTADLAADVQAAAAAKPTIAFGEDLVASAALWVATQATQFFANSVTAHIGSIGTLLGLYDMSGMAGQEGIKALVFATGPLKGAGFPGAEITSEQKDYFQQMVNEIQPAFTQAVANGRKLSTIHVNALATGGVFSAPKAKEAGLIDGIQSFDQTLNQMFAEMPQPTQSKRGSKMTTQTRNEKLEARLDEDAEPNAETMRASITADLAKFVAKFGAENGSKWFTEAKSYEQALEAHVGVLEAKMAADREASDKLIKEADAKIAELETALKEVKLGETAAVSFQDGEKGKKAASVKNSNNLGTGLSALAAEIEDKMPGAKASA